MNTFLNFMKRNYKILALVLVASLTLWGFIPKQKGDPEKDKLLLELLTFVIEKGHYSPAQIDDNFSKSLFKEYIKSLDPTKRFFLQSDIEEFSKYETDLDDQIKNKDLTFFDLTYSRLKQRIEESKTYYKSILSQPFEFNGEEEINSEYENVPYDSSISDLKEKWRKQLKLSVLSSLTDRLKLEEDIKNGVIKAKKDSLSVNKPDKSIDNKPKTFEQIEKEKSLKFLLNY